MKKNKQEKKSNAFSRRLLYVLMAIGVVGIVLIAILGTYLYIYEHNHPKYLVDSIVEDYKAKEFDEILDKSNKEQRAKLKKALPNIVKKDKLFAYQSFEDKQKIEYTVVNNNQKLSTIVIEKLKDTALFHIQKVRVKEISHFPAYQYRVHYFAGTSIFVNGEDVSEMGKETSVSEQFSAIGYQEMKTYTYSYDSFEPIGNLKATYLGKPCTKVVDASGYDISFYPTIPNQQVAPIQSTLEQFSQEYARYTTLRGVGSGTLLQYVVPNSTLAQLITSYSNTWGEVSIAQSFSSINFSNPFQYYDGIYSYDVHLTFYITADTGDKKEFPMDYRMFVMNTGYGYQVFDMERISKEEKGSVGDTSASLITPSFIVGNAALNSQCVDQSTTTGYTFQDEDSLQIKSKEDIGYVYITWGSGVKPYTVQYNQKKIRQGKNGFLHELIKVNKATKEITLSSLKGNDLKEIVVYSKGELPAGVQDWETPNKECDILAFPTHADDDTLYMGALLSEYAAKGKKIQLAFLTNSNSSANTKDVDVRQHEMLDGMWEMGLRAYPIVGDFEDIGSRDIEHAKSVYNQDAILQFQVQNIRRFKPSIIIGHDENGEYGHGVHMLNTAMLKKAISLAKDKSYDEVSYKKYGIHETKKTYLHLYTKHQIVLDVHKKMKELDGRSPFEVATSAYGKHVSQHQYELAVEDLGIGDCRLFGLYDSVVGYEDKDNNIFTGIE